MYFFNLGKHIKFKITVSEKIEVSKIWSFFITFLNIKRNKQTNKFHQETRIILVYMVQYMNSNEIVILQFFSHF